MIQNQIAATILALLLALGDAKNIRHKTSRLPEAIKSSSANRVKGIKGNRGLREGTERRAQEGDLEAEDHGIIGGMVASSGEFPFFAKFEGGTLCGGSLISPDTVLTAAHCVDGSKPNQLRFGSDLYSQGGILVDTQCAVSHPDFIENDKTLMNDVAIIKLKEPITDPSVSTITYNTNTAYPSASGTQLTVIGFGITENGGSVASVLQKLNTNFVSIDQCMATYTEAVVNPENHICADVPNAGDCNGDSGGPVFAGGLQVGIVSFGYGGCASAQYQDVYVNVAAYSDWITSYVNGENCQPAGDDGSGAEEDTGDTDVEAGDDDEEEPSDLDALLDCFTTIMDLVQGLLGGGNAKGGGDKDENKEDNKGGDKDNGGTQKGTFVTMQDFLYGRDGEEGPSPGFVGSVQNFFSNLNPSNEDFGDNARAIGIGLGIDEALAETAVNNDNDGGR